MIKLLTTNEMGRGLYASRLIKQGEVLLECELLVLNEGDTIKVNETDLKYYTFKYDSNRDCLVLGLGEIFNHSEMPNVSYKLVPFQDRLVMQFKALIDISEESQLMIDYSADCEVNTHSYVEKESLLK